MGREAYCRDPKGDVSLVKTYDQGARAATFDFLLNSVTSCVPFSVTAELTADTGDDQGSCKIFQKEFPKKSALFFWGGRSGLLCCVYVSFFYSSLCRLVAMSVELKLSRSNRIFRPNEPLEGKIITKLPSSISHNGIRLTVNGSVTLQVRGGSAGVIESLYGVLKPIPIVNKSIEVRSSGRIGSGTTEIPFSVILKRPGDDNLERFYETFHGGNVSIQYLVTVDVVRGYLHKSLSATVEFIIESEKASLPDQPVSPELVIFYITQDTQRHSLLPELRSGGFRVTGKIGTQCSLLDPLKGELTVEASAVRIHSIDIHLLRVESILVGERIITETSLIQTTQIADGDVCRNITLPIYIILPRLLTCPTIYAGPFSIEFKVSVVITFQSELLKLNPKSDPQTPRLWLAMESVPLELIRTK